MTNYYFTSTNDETLDYICWRHYIRNDLLRSAANPFNIPILNNFLNMFSAEDSGINGIIEKVLEANPGLSNYLHLPPGLEVVLPDIKELPVDQSLQDLWN
ncbi:MAG: tail protein X [Pseudomonadota bacterium]